MDVESGSSALFGDLGDSYVRDLPELSMAFTADQVPAPELVALSEALALELGLDIDQLRSPAGVAVLSGNQAPAGSNPVALCYAGHQFGGYSPRLGDGRAVLLGEFTSPDDERVDIHLKGSGRTPYSRGGDGKATLGPMLREYVFAEAMHALGVPTTRALAIISTGESIRRETMEPGALLVRTASSHLRVGTFEYAARLEDKTVVRRLADHAIERHYPEARAAENPYLALLNALIETQARLVASWMHLGFIHGVLNTDNVTISGETIDYGPCAFMDVFDPDTVFSSIDHGGRYAYGSQPMITQWNLTRFAETLIPLIADDVDTAIELATAAIHTYPAIFHEFWLEGMRGKLAITAPGDADEELVNDFLGLLHSQQVDYTSSFRALAASLRGDQSQLAELFDDAAAVEAWAVRWHELLPVDHDDVARQMDSVNPIYIPRNHLVDHALAAAVDGDHAPFDALLDAVLDPFNERDGLERFAIAGSEEFNRSFKTFCGT